MHTRRYEWPQGGKGENREQGLGSTLKHFGLLIDALSEMSRGEGLALKEQVARKRERSSGLEWGCLRKSNTVSLSFSV